LTTEQVRQIGSHVLLLHPVAKIVPEIDLLLLASLDQTGEGITTSPLIFRAGAAADLPLDDIGANIAFTEVVVKRDVRTSNTSGNSFACLSLSGTIHWKRRSVWIQHRPVQQFKKVDADFRSGAAEPGAPSYFGLKSPTNPLLFGVFLQEAHYIPRFIPCFGGCVFLLRCS